ncbi:MAG TPA: hypothetical protein VFK30_07300 [Anaerolineae bacterium]|nr:hypothetical protein [Anaerolineae bacterium]
MSADKREDILARLFTVLSGIRNITTVARNIDEMPEGSRPCIVLIDGDEIRSDTSRGKALQTVVMVMTPRIAIGISSSPDNLGPDINAIRAKVLPAVLGDATLTTILGTNGKITYDGLAGKLSQGSLMASDMELNFSIEYPLDIKALA